MIIGLILSALLGLVNYVFGLLPYSTLPVAVTGGLRDFLQSVYQFNGIFPIDTAFTMLGLTAVFWGIIFSFDFVKWVIHLVRGN